MNRRIFLISTAAAFTARPSLSAQSNVTSGGLGLTLADVQSMYEEGPPGQGFRNFIEPQSGATLYIDFGDDDLAQNIWVSGELDTVKATELIHWLCPDDIVQESWYEILTGAGSIAFRQSLVFTSPFLAGLNADRTQVLATWEELPSGQEAGVVENLMLTIEQKKGRR